MSRPVYREFRPPAPLRPLVRRLWWSYRPAAAHAHLSLPDITSDLVFTVDDVEWEGGGASLEFGSGALYLSGPLTRAATHAAACATLSVGVRFEPWGAHALAGKPMAAFRDTSIAAPEIWGPFGEAWCRRLEDATTLDDLVTELTRPLWRHSLMGSDDLKLLAALWRRLALDAGCGDVLPTAARLSEVSGLSQRHLRRLFDRWIGLNPQTVISILRFQCVVRALDGATRPDWAALATRCGYYDQAHLIKKFKKFVADTPAAVFSNTRRPRGR